MARTYLQDLEEISATFPAIGPGERDALLWRAIVDICNENDLSFMIGEARIVTEAPYKTGTVATTALGTGLVLTGGTWDHVNWTNRKVKIQGREEVYRIGSFTNGTTAVLADPWLGATLSGLSYFIFRDTYDAPADCEFTKEALLFDPVLKQRIDFVDHGIFRERKREHGAMLGQPDQVARVGLSATGVPQIEFGSAVPDSARVYNLDYFRSPQKPAALGNGMNPAWPTAYEDVRVKRVLFEYAKRKGHPRRFEFERDYKDRVWDMVRKFDGGNEMRRRIEGTRAKGSRGFTIRARWGG